MSSVRALLTSSPKCNKRKVFSGSKVTLPVNFACKPGLSFNPLARVTLAVGLPYLLVNRALLKLRGLRLFFICEDGAGWFHQGKATNWIGSALWYLYGISFSGLLAFLWVIHLNVGYKKYFSAMEVNEYIRKQPSYMINRWVSRWRVHEHHCCTRRSQKSSLWNGLFVRVTQGVKFSWRHQCSTLFMSPCI